MKELLIFIFGIIFIIFIIPTIDGILSILLTYFEQIKAIIAEKINAINIKIKETAESSNVNKNIIIGGFIDSTDSKEEDDDNDL